ncbi:DUF5937 family protein, partial [Spirillospora sp. NPDC046719]
LPARAETGATAEVLLGVDAANKGAAVGSAHRHVQRRCRERSRRRRVELQDAQDARARCPGRRRPSARRRTGRGVLGNSAGDRDALLPAALRAVPAEEVRADLDRTCGVRTASLRELYAHPSSGLGRLAGEIRAFWESALAEDWPRVRALLEADVLYRAREQTDGGPARLFNALDPAIRWRGDSLSIRLAHHSAAQRLDGRGVVLVPSAFAWPRVLVKTGPVWPVTVRYSPRGVGLLWTADRPAAPDALAGVLGATRAMLLTALRAAGLVTARRSGRYVLYTRTAVADRDSERIGAESGTTTWSPSATTIVPGGQRTTR